MLRAHRTPLSSNSLRLRELGRKDGQDLFRRTTFINPATLIAGEDIPMAVGMVFSDMEIEKAGRHDPRPEPQQGPLPVGHDRLEDNPLYISYEDILQYALQQQAETKKTTAILMEGVAGVGKTTYLKYLKSNFSECNYGEIKELKKFDLMISMDCRNSSIESLKDLLRGQWPTAREEFDRMGEDMLQYLLGLRCLFLCDGFDETNTASSKLFDNILHQMNHDTMLICTTRPEKVPEYYDRTCDMNVDTIHVKIKGVARNKIVLFITKYHEELRRKGISLQATSGLICYYNRKGHRLVEYWQIPLNLMLLIMLWALDHERVNQVTTVVELYEQINVLLTRKALERIRRKSHQMQQEVEANFNHFQKELNKEALIGLHKDEIILGQAAIQRLRDCCVRLSLPQDEALGTFLVQKTTWINNGVSLEELEFHHKSTQEYHAASCIDDKVIGNGALPGNEEIVTQISEVLSRCNVHDQTRQDILISVQSILERGQQEPSTGRGTILQVLQEVCGEEDLDAGKFSNVFIMLLGRMYKDGHQANPSKTSEVINLLLRSGVQSREQWITVLNSIKCCETVIRLIVDRVPQLKEGTMRISDNDVFAYASLLKLVTPQGVSLIIKSNPINVPALEELLFSLAQHQCPVSYLFLNHLFRKDHRDPFNTPIYEGLQKTLARCSGVESYMGPMVDSLRSQTRWLKGLHVNITEEDEFIRLQDFLYNTDHTVEFLGVCVDLHRVDTHILQPLKAGNVKSPPHLYLPGITSEDECERAGVIAKNLLPTTGRNKGCFSGVFFPNAELDQEKLIQVLQGVRVIVYLVLPLHLKPPIEADENNLQQLAKSICGGTVKIIWGYPEGGRGNLNDMDTW